MYLRCGCTRVGCSTLSCLSTCKSLGLSSKWVWKEGEEKKWKREEEEKGRKEGKNEWEREGKR